jgi:hypothetical protein
MATTKLLTTYLDYTQPTRNDWTGKVAVAFFARTIKTARLDDNELTLTFVAPDSSPAGRLVISDEAQSCCEKRYLTCDDDLGDLIGQRLVHIMAKPGPAWEDGNKGDIWEENFAHETCFVEVMTNRGSITLCTHNEHNGYYGGFRLGIIAFS